VVTPIYRGRFAPSPSGPLHFGSLVAALASYLDARAHGGEWILRIEDLDAPRVAAGATQDIIDTLSCHGFIRNGEVVRQSTRSDHYRNAWAILCAQGQCYPCACSRREIADSSLDPDRRQVYPGTCRNGLASGRPARAWRVRVPDAGSIAFTDRWVGDYAQTLATEVGDFVVGRTDGSWAYQLAVVVDDYLQGITHVVRGVDLLDSTARQIYLQTCLGYPRLSYLHVPVVLTTDGDKLSKQTGATALDKREPIRTLIEAIEFLGFAVPASASGSLGTYWDWAVAAWAERFASD
jgi:glutamyl-Q tRNA(Asp) synthetase